MKTITMRYSLLFLLMPFLSFAGIKGEKLEKEINRQFSIQTNGVLKINNKYGAVDITTGTSNQIKIKVKVTAEASSKSKAQETLDRVNILFDEGGNEVSAVTQVESSSGFKTWFSSSNMNVEINYTVVVPADIYLKLANRYGTVYVETTDRDLEIDLAYGDIRLGDVHANLSLEMAYSEGSISNIKYGQIKLEYSELQMEDAESVVIQMQYTELSLSSVPTARIDASYSEFEANQIGSLTYTGKYADVAIGRVGSIDAKSSYTDIEIGAFDAKGNISMTYGELEIENIGSGLTQLDIKTSYTDVSLAFLTNANYTIDATTSYCDIKHRNLKVIEFIDKGSSSSLKGSNGSGGGIVLVKMTYGDLDIN